jgi:hypothetical protein
MNHVPKSACGRGIHGYIIFLYCHNYLFIDEYDTATLPEMNNETTMSTDVGVEIDNINDGHVFSEMSLYLNTFNKSVDIKFNAHNAFFE